jgi:beta-glucanase (GH16 family)
VNTLFRRDWPSGTFTARIKFDVAPGSWQTFFLSGASGSTWPANGEVDVAEITGKTPTLSHHRLHSSRVSAPSKRCSQGADPALRPDGRWRTYSVTMAPDRVVFRADGQVLGTYEPIQACSWPFGDRMRITFGARGGRYGGEVDVSAYPVTYLVDWVAWEPLS